MAKGGNKSNTNVYDQSANALGQAGGAYQDAASLLGKSGVNAAQLQYAPAQYQAAQGNASLAANPNAIYSGIINYMNPYTSEVINRSATDVNNSLLTQLDQIGSTAAQSGAFGGSRHGLVEATAMSEAQKNIGDLSANLRNQGYNTALQYSAQDVANSMQNTQFNAGQKQNMSLANLGYLNTARQTNAGATNTARQWNAQTPLLASQNNQNIASGLVSTGNAGEGLGMNLFGIGQGIDQAQLQQGSMQQALIQSIMDMAGGQYQGYVNQPKDILNMAIAALSANPMQNATTTTGSYSPGWFDYLSLGAQTAGGLRRQ